MPAEEQRQVSQLSELDQTVVTAGWQGLSPGAMRTILTFSILVLVIAAFAIAIAGAFLGNTLVVAVAGGLFAAVFLVLLATAFAYWFGTDRLRAAGDVIAKFAKR